MSFLSAISKGVKGVINEVDGLLNKDRRHDEEHEQAQDAVRAEINAGHRFHSFARQREGNYVKWHVDGHDFFWALSEIIDSAKEAIFIQDWWLSPEVYLRRPPAKHPEWRLDRLLKRKADQGVKIHIIVYKEVEATMSMSSVHTKDALHALHPNIGVMRHPDHIGSQDSVQFWSHHEKVVVVDNHIASIGGLDLCYGRWDTHNHPLSDAHPTDFDRTLFPGQDYNNARVLDFQKVDQYFGNMASILESPRMPWHDVHMTIVGPSVLDIVQHFVERWNEIKKRKYTEKDQNRFPWLALPHDVSDAPHEAVARHPHRESWATHGRHYRQRFLRGLNWEQQEEDHPEPSDEWNCRVQVVRSCSDWSHGVLKETSIQEAYITLIREAKHFIYIENQFFISNTGDYGPVQNRVAAALVERILRAARAGEKFKIIVVIPEVPGFSGDIKDTGAIKTIMAAQWRTINRGGHSIYESVKEAGYEPMEYIRFYHLRSYDRINAPYPSFISSIEEKSGVKFHEAQVALARRWVGNDATQQTTVIIKAPKATKDGLVEEGKASEDKPVPLPPTEEAAKEIIDRFEAAARSVRSDERVSDSIAQHALIDKTDLTREQWLGTEAEEREAYVTELLYIHSKVMIVDDRRVIMGSANLNDRSQKGNGDSEIALVVEDNEELESTMNGQPFTAARFAGTLRRHLFREHLGLIKPQVCEPGRDHVTPYMRPAPHGIPHVTDQEDLLVMDPLSQEFQDLWIGTAKNNTQIFSEIFRMVPSDNVRSFTQYDRYVPSVKAGHVAPDIPLSLAKARLSGVRGHLVESPLEFLIEEKALWDNPDWLGVNPTLPIYI